MKFYLRIHDNLTIIENKNTKLGNKTSFFSPLISPRNQTEPNEIC